jgi:hypothetical protein
MPSCRELSLLCVLSLVTVCLLFAGIPTPKSTGTIKLISLAPEDGSSVGRDSVVAAELQFTIDNFKARKDRYFVSILFQTSGSRAAMFSNSPGDIVMLTEATGTITLAYPLDRVWDDPQLRKPLVVRYFLQERTGKKESIVLDQTDEIHFAVGA